MAHNCGTDIAGMSLVVSGLVWSGSSGSVFPRPHRINLLYILDCLKRTDIVSDVQRSISIARYTAFQKPG